MGHDTQIEKAQMETEKEEQLSFLIRVLLFDIKAPLSRMGGYAELLRTAIEPPDLQEDIDEYLDGIMTSLNQAVEIMIESYNRHDEILKLSQSNDNEMGTEKERQLSRLFLTIGSDIKSPLSMIGSSAEFLKTDIESAEDLSPEHLEDSSKWIESIISGVTSAYQLIAEAWDKYDEI